ncbi:MAG: hypothetical protein H7263_06630, partial [Candidatus Sericytochromatia bacterium]|nr:hypothetical protein [Candidatus Sericytochromatia bacterium]
KSNFLIKSIIFFTIYSSSFIACSEEIISVRESKKNSILAGISLTKDTTNSSSVDLPLLRLEYNHNFNKNYSLGLNAGTLIVYNQIDLFGRYYLDFISTKNAAFYFQGNLGYSEYSLQINQDVPRYINLIPELGYEFREDNGFTFNASLIPIGIGFSVPQNKISNFILYGLTAEIKLGYSF